MKGFLFFATGACMFAANSTWMKNSFVLNDESRLNSHGFVLLNTGGKFDRFKANPAMLHNHNEEELVGRWENLRVDGKQLLSDPVFDTEDDFSKKIAGKVERGFLKGASMGIYIEAAELQPLPGIGLVPVVTDWELLESSVVAVPSNQMSLRLYSKNGELLSSPDSIKLSIDSLINKNKPENQMEKILLTAEAATALNLSKEPEATALNAAIMVLAASKAKAENDLKAHLSAQAKALVDGAISEGRLTADKRESFEKLAMADFKQAKDIIDALPAKQTFSDKTKTPKSAAEGRDDWNYLKWAKEDPSGLAEMQTREPQRFAELKANYKSKR